MEEKKNKFYTKWWFWLIITIIIIGVALSVVSNNIINIGGNPVTYTSTGTQNQKITTKDLKANIVIEAIGLTKNGDFAFKVKNNNNEPVYIDTVNTIFKDSAGNFMEKAESQNQFFSIDANSEIINYAWGFRKDFSQYPIQEFEIELLEANSWVASDLVPNNFEITANNTGKQVSVQLKNNNNVDVENVIILVAYYQNGQIVGCVNGYANDTTTSANGTAYINVRYPEDSNYKEVKFDDYKVYFIEASKAY